MTRVHVEVGKNIKTATVNNLIGKVKERKAYNEQTVSYFRVTRESKGHK